MGPIASLPLCVWIPSACCKCAHTLVDTNTRAHTGSELQLFRIWEQGLDGEQKLILNYVQIHIIAWHSILGSSCGCSSSKVSISYVSPPGCCEDYSLWWFTLVNSSWLLGFCFYLTTSLMASPCPYEDSGTASSEFLVPWNNLPCLCNCFSPLWVPDRPWAAQGQGACSQYPFLFLVPCGTQQVLIKCRTAERMGGQCSHMAAEKIAK